MARRWFTFWYSIQADMQARLTLACERATAAHIDMKTYGQSLAAVEALAEVAVAVAVAVKVATWLRFVRMSHFRSNE